MTVAQPRRKGAPPVVAKFFKDGNKDAIEISIIGDPNTFHGKVTPEHINRFPREWEAYQAGQDLPKPDGTPLTEIPGLGKS